jgi:uncharacterized membrane protein
MAFAHGMGFGFGLGFLNFLGTVLFFVLLVWALKLFFRGERGWTPPGRYRRWERGEGDEAMKAARERLAQGEISANEFEAIKKGLRSDAPQEGPPFEAWFKRRDGALDSVRLRLARGEITIDEFEAVKRALQGLAGKRAQEPVFRALYEPPRKRSMLERTRSRVIRQQEVFSIPQYYQRSPLPFTRLWRRYC